MVCVTKIFGLFQNAVEVARCEIEAGSPDAWRFTLIALHTLEVFSLHYNRPLYHNADSMQFLCEIDDDQTTDEKNAKCAIALDAAEKFIKDLTT